MSVRVRFVVDKVAGRQVFQRAPFQHSFIISPYPSTCRSYQKEKKPENSGIFTKKNLISGSRGELDSKVLPLSLLLKVKKGKVSPLQACVAWRGPGG